MGLAICFVFFVFNEQFINPIVSNAYAYVNDFGRFLRSCFERSTQTFLQQANFFFYFSQLFVSYLGGLSTTLLNYF